MALVGSNYTKVKRVCYFPAHMALSQVPVALTMCQDE